MKKVNIGGQAVLEGVMMKGPESYALAVRTPDKSIDVQVTPYKSIGEKHKLAGIPIVRGVINFIESLYIGIGTLMKSSEYYEDEEDNSEDEKKTAKKKKPEKTEKQKETEEKAYLIGTLIMSLVIAIGVFMLIPVFLAHFMNKITDNDLIINLTEGVLRLLIFLGYVALISCMQDIKRTFMYHGAEHKTINCLEAGEDLTVENVKKHTRFHKRCGTSFVFIVMIISIVVFMFVRTDVLWLKMVSRLLLIPVIAGLSYEFIRYAGKHDNVVSNILSQPGLWVQRLTTREPDDSMIEVAIASVDAVIDWHEYVDCVRNNSFEK
jgi:Predicted metal-dependent enzyme